MKKFGISIISFFILMLACKQQKLILKSASPSQLYSGLFEAVQTGKVFQDSKTFTDCIPKRNPGDILKDYNQIKNHKDFDLKTFVKNNFDEPAASKTNYQSNRALNVEDHIKELWDILKRQPEKGNSFSSLIALPNQYIVPGGRFREIYYWDSYFTMLGLAESGKLDMIENMVNNFAWLIRTYGFIPNGNRTYYLTRSQPPYFSLMLKLLVETKKSKGDSILKANRDALEKEYHFWMNSDDKKGSVGHLVHLPDGSILNRYFDKGDWPREEAYLEDVKTAKESGKNAADVYRNLRSGAESGWDFSSRWFEDGKSLKLIQTTDIIPIDLNCLMYHLEWMLATCYQNSGNKDKSAKYLKLAEGRKSALYKYCWNKESGYFRDFDWKQKKQTKRATLAGMYPLYFKMATSGQADSIAIVLKRDFLKAGGLVTSMVKTGQQWDAPNGWAPLQWMAIAGLSNYNKKDLAREIAHRWSHLNIRVYSKTGKLLEKYNVVDTTLIAGGGEYPTQDGFGWTNGVLLKLLKTYPVKP